MKNYCNGHYTGERALFRVSDASIDNCLFDDGESPLKESERLKVSHTTFGWKYPLWYGKGHLVSDCTFLETARSGLWYTNESSFQRCDFIAPKLFRRCDGISITDSKFEHAQETLWSCKRVFIQNTTFKGDYVLKDAEDVTLDSVTIDGNYAFDGGKKISVKNCVLNTKDAFWNCENVTIEDSTIDGEYFAWNTRNITLINCKVRSNQGFCYMDNVKLVNCSLEGTTLSFEYCSNIDAEVNDVIDSVKNPISGHIFAKGIKELILDENARPGSNCNIETEGN